MIEAIIRWSVSNRFFVLLATIIIVGGGLVTMKNTPVDAIPDLSDVQVIIKTSYPGQAPQVVEDQVTYPLTTAMLSVPVHKRFEVIRFSVTPTFISFLMMIPTYIGQEAGCLNIYRKLPPIYLKTPGRN